METASDSFCGNVYINWSELRLQTSSLPNTFNLCFICKGFLSCVRWCFFPQIQLGSSMTFKYILNIHESVQFSGSVWLFATPWTVARQASLSYTNSWSLLKLIHQASDAIQPFHSLSCPSPPAFNLSQHQGLPMSQFFTSGGQSIGVSASASVLPMNIQDWFSLGWTGWISLQSKGLSRVFFNITVQKHQFFSAQFSL